MLYYNAKIYGRNETAFNVRGGKFDTFYHSLGQMPSDATDLNGQWVLPGFNDSHGHFIGIAYLAKMRSLENTRTPHDLKAVFAGVSGFAMGVKYDDKVLDLGRYLEKADLEALNIPHPIIVLRVCGHFAVANQAAMDRAKAFHDHSPAEQNVDFERGHFKEEGIKWLQAPFFNPSVDDLKEEILWTQNHVLKYGITAFASDDFITYPVPYERVIEAYQELATKEALRVRLYQQAHLKTLDLIDDFFKKGYAHKKYGRFTMGPSKLLVDGSLGAQTAAMKAPYQGTQNTGLLNYDKETLKAYLSRLNKYKMDFAWHAIGDRTTQVIIDAVNEEGLFKGARPAMIHAQLTGLEEIKQMKALNIGAQIQPIFLDDDLPIIKTYLGPKAADTYLFKTLYDSVPTSLSTDAPIVSVNPFLNMYAAITRTSIKYNELPPHLKQEALTLPEAIEAYTRQGAYFMRQEKLGALDEGFLADFIVVKDLDFNDVESLKKATVMLTVIEGEIEYQVE
jgi:predicted amidohydrolase YtcJ